MFQQLAAPGIGARLSAQALSGVPLHGLRDPPKSNLSPKRDEPDFGGLRYSLLVVNSHEENRNGNALSHGNKT